MKRVNLQFKDCLFFIPAFFLFLGCTNNNSPQQFQTPLQKLQTSFRVGQEEPNLLSKKVFADRMDLYFQHLQKKGVEIKHSIDLLKLIDPIAQKQFCNNYNIDSLWLLVHVELAQLVQIGLSEIDAQMLHFSHWNYQDPFTGAVMNPKILTMTDLESIFMDIAGWAAGRSNPLVDSYACSLSDISHWKKAAVEYQKKQDNIVMNIQDVFAKNY